MVAGPDSVAATAGLRVLYVPGDPAGPEERAAWQWLCALEGVEASWHGPGEGQAPGDGPESGGGPGADVEGADVVWVHASGDVAASDPRLEAVRGRLATGRGGVLLSLLAVALPSAWGLEPTPPDDVRRGVWHDRDDDLPVFDDFAAAPRIRGHAGFRSHPLFAGLDAGVYTWAPVEGEAFRAAMRRPASWPGSGGVIAVERSYINVNPERATAWELSAGVGRLLCIGAYFCFEARDDRFSPALQRFAGNALAYAAGRHPQPDVKPRFWRVPATVSPAVAESAALAVPDVSPALAGVTLPDVGVALEGPVGAGDTEAAGPGPRPFTVAGRRAFAAGDEAGGVREVWVHPLRVVSDLRLSAGGTPARALSARVSPVGLERRLDAGGVAVTERLLVARDQPGIVLAWTAGSAVDLDLEWTTDLRLMWPYPAGCLGPLRWRRQERAWAVRAEDGDVALFALGREPETWAVEDATAAGVPAARFRVGVRLGAGETLRLALAAGDGDDPGPVEDALRRALEADGIAAVRAAATRRARRERLAVSSPEPRVDEALRWAVHRLDSALVETPGCGRSLVAGYWTSTPGWGDGRPGYAWYFGRDAVWTALACLAAGDFAAAADVIRFLGEHQDPSGKILHECTTSGLVHYDAADASPLYLLLVARYLAWSGDAATVARQWDRAKQAFRFCLWMDHDDDGLIENTRAGHGWIEFGRLGGGTVTVYNAGVWTAALAELAVAAETLGDHAFATDLHRRASVARAALERVFATAGGYALNVRRVQPAGRAGPGEPGSQWVANTAWTPLQAVPLLLGVADPDRAGAWLDAVASPDFAADWGVRMVPLSDPEYNPGSYHGGAVWPLFTGWVAWAQYASGRPDAGYALWRANVERAFRHERGAWPEVLHGTDERLAGVCPDQAWSAAMAVAPLVYGLLGVEPDAPKGRLTLRPRIPGAWTHLEVRGLRLGDGDVSLHYRREGTRHTFRMEQEQGSVPFTLILEPALPGERLLAARVDDEPAELDARHAGGRVRVPVQLVLDRERTVELVVDAGAARETGAPGAPSDGEGG